MTGKIIKQRAVEDKVAKNLAVMPQLVKGLRSSQERINSCISQIRSKVEELDFTESKIDYHVNQYEGRIYDSKASLGFLDIEYKQIVEQKNHFIEVTDMLMEQIDILNTMINQDTKEQLKQLNKVTKKVKGSQKKALKLIHKIEKSRKP